MFVLQYGSKNVMENSLELAGMSMKVKREPSVLNWRTPWVQSAYSLFRNIAVQGTNVQLFKCNSGRLSLSCPVVH